MKKTKDYFLELQLTLLRIEKDELREEEKVKLLKPYNVKKNKTKN